MSKIEFKQIEFKEIEEKEKKDKENNINNQNKENNINNQNKNKEPNNNKIKAIFLNRYYFIFDKSELNYLKNVKINKNSISSDDDEKKLNKEFAKILNHGFENLINSVTGRKTIYIHQNSGIPLIGTNTFGIVDRNTNCIEIKPLTGCNLNCIYCSVDEGSKEETKKINDFIVEKDYLVAELKKLFDLKKDSEAGLEIHIGPQGEPLLYPELSELIHDIRKDIKKIKRISMDTNGLLLNEKYVDELVKAGLTRFNISLNSINNNTCNKLANRNYNLNHLISMIHYIDQKHASKGKCEIILAPVMLTGFNDSEEELDSLMTFAKKLSGLKNGIKVAFQNFLSYPKGRNPVKEKSWEEFFSILKKLEQKHQTKLIFDATDFSIEKNDVLEKPFKKGDTIKAEIKCRGLYKNERIAVAGERSITVHNCTAEKGIVKIKITRDKHNVYDGALT